MPIIGIIDSSRRGIPVGNFVSLQTLTGTGSSGTLTFTNIPQTFKHLEIHALTKGTATGSNIQGMYTIQFNGDTGNNYSNTQSVGRGTGASQIYRVSLAGQNAIFGNGSNWYNTFCSGADSTAMGAAVININEYTNPSWYKSARVFNGHERGNNDDSSRISIGGGAWASTNPITSITFKIYDESLSLTNFTTTTQIALYGIVG